jgi:CTP:molybdopterin cytidylyltransferase MocA
MHVAAVILAAGASTRFGSPKQAARLGGRTLLEIAIDLAHDAGLHPVIAVVPPGLAVPAHAIPEVNDAPIEGMSRSLRLGLAAVPAEAEAAIILLVDQPTLPVATIRAVLDAGGQRPVVAAWADGRLGPPVLLRREAFSLADAATGDEGLRSIMADHPDMVTAVEVGVHAPDVDTPADLRGLGEVAP